MKKLFYSILTYFVSGLLACQAANVIVPPMVTLPTGDFMMGTDIDPAGDGKHNPLETPVHSVHVSTFKLAKYATTVRQFREFVDATGYQTGNQCWQWTHPGAAGIYLKVASGDWQTPANAPSDFHPVMCVSWNDAQAYVNWLSRQTGRHFRLPSEAEWEYAARAGTTTRYPFGDDPAKLCQYANVFDQAGKFAFRRDLGLDWTAVPCNDGAEFTTIVGTYAPNAWGLYDMIGNVGQWTADCEHADYVGAPADGSAWTSNCSSHGEVLYITRGGSYAAGPINARPTTRSHAGQSNRSSLGEGFRIAEDAGDKPCDGEADCAASPATQQFLADIKKAQTAELFRRKAARPTAD